MDRIADRDALRRRRRGWRRIAGLCCLVALLALGGCKVDLYTNLDEQEANEMLAVLLNNGIPASRVAGKDGLSTVRIDEAHFAPAVDLLKASGYPRQVFQTMGDVFAGDGLISSPTEERARFIYALSQELSRTISDIDGVLTARIHVALPKSDPLRLNTTPSSASVFVRHDADLPLGDLLPQIKMLVANSIEGLTYDNVSLVLVPVERGTTRIRLAAGVLEPPPPAGLATPVLAALLAAGIAGCAGAGGFWLVRRRRAAAAADGAGAWPDEDAAGRPAGQPADPARA